MFVNVLLPVDRTAALLIFAVAAVPVIALDSPVLLCCKYRQFLLFVQFVRFDELYL